MTYHVGALLAERAATDPDAPFLRFSAAELTFAQADVQTNAVARGLAALGVRAGDRVAILLPNCVEMVLTWLAANRLGAVAAPVNTAFRGPALAHVLTLSGAKVLVVDPSLAEHVEGFEFDAVVVRGPQWTALTRYREEPLENRGRPGDPALVLFTSGTTGRSKGCVLAHRFVVRQAELLVDYFALRADDVLYCPYPLFHLDATVLTVVPALVLGATAAIGARFSASGFWDEVRRFGATVFDFMGATLTILYKREPREDDRDHAVRLGWGIPMPDFAEAFEERFGVHLVESYGSTDVGVPIFYRADEPRRAGACGRPIPQYDVRLLDPDDHEVPVGDVLPRVEARLQSLVATPAGA